MCIAHEAEKYGVLSINGKAMTAHQIARMVGESPAVVSRLLVELEDAGVFSRDEKGAIFSRRMVKDERIRNVRAEAGRLGGNPDLLKQKDKQKDKQADNPKPTPSSSSSSSNLSEDKSSGVETPKITDPDEIIFSFGLPLLVTAGTPEKQARSFLGGLRKHHGDAALINSLRECIKTKPLQPLEWLAKALPPAGIVAKVQPIRTPSPDNFEQRDYGTRGRL